MTKKTISYTVELFRMAESRSFTSPADLTRDLIDHMFKDSMHSHEEMHAIFLNNRLEICFTQKIGMGDISSTVMSQSSMYTTAHIQRTPRLILVHNHPSGHPNFSSADINMGKRVKQACDIMGLELIDFIMVTPDYTVHSLKNKGII